MGGERVQQELLRELQALPQAPGLQLTNCYGPTEITAAVTFDSVSLGSIEQYPTYGPSSVGKVLPNYAVYITDQAGNALPAGTMGEICISGAGVALGYLGQPDLTRARFLRNPYATQSDRAKGWEHMYRTGDRGWLSADGNLYLAGRIEGDTQVKLHGQRIELDEVATSLRRKAPRTFAEVVVSLRGDPAFMVAHVVFASSMTMTPTGLANLARTLPLPRYMIPAAIIPLDGLPMTVNGKIDRKATAELPMPEIEQKLDDARPLTPAEANLRLIWHEVLPQGCPKDPNADFFMHGGNSILLAKLQARIKSSVGIHVPIVDLYSASTLEQMATRLSARHRTLNGLDEQPAIDWVCETATPAGLAAHKTTKPTPNPGGLRVLLTGSTGFFGQSLMKCLLKNPRISLIHCVAVAEEDQRHIPLSAKVNIYTGSLAQKNLRLSEHDYQSLQENTDVIIHAGSMGHCLHNYSSLRIPNLESTRFLATLAASRSIQFHYLSSSRVTLLSGSMELPPVSLASTFPNTNGSEGFTTSKWASERLLENFARDTNLEVTIHRPCAPLGPEAPSEDALNALLQFSASMHAVPRFDHFEGYFDFKDVDALACDVVSAILGSFDRFTGPVQFVHHSRGQRLPISKLRRHLQEIHGAPFAEISVEEWIEHALAAGIDPRIASYLDSVIRREERLQFPFLGA